MKENWEIHWKDYYRVLQVDPAAEPEVVKAAYDRLARKYHPDISKNPSATARMSEINEAYEVLGDPVKRKQYHSLWLEKAKPTVKYHLHLSLGWIMFLGIIIAGIVLAAVYLNRHPVSLPGQIIEPESVSQQPDIKIKSITLPAGAKVSAGDSLYEQTWVLTNKEPADVRVYWEAVSSLTGVFDSGYVSVPANDSREVKRSYSYSVAGNETVTYRITYGTITLDTLSATHEIGK